MNDYKKLFPIFVKNPELHYLDSGATTLKPLVVLDKMMEYYTEYSANIHRGLYPMSERATEEYEKVREKVASLINAEYENEILFTSGTTDSLNLVATGWGEKNLVEGDEMVVTEMEHHSNLVPWQELAKKMKLRLRFVEVVDFKLDVSELGKIINERTKILTLTQVSNVLGTVNQVKEIAKAVKQINPDVVVVVDGAQAVAHMRVDVRDLDVDFYAFSGHKMYGPTGVGVLYARAIRQLEMNPGRFGGGMIKEVNRESSTWADGPEKFEAGTPPIAEVIGLGAAVDFIEELGIDNIKAHEDELVAYALKELEKHPDLKVIGPKIGRLGVFSMRFVEEALGSAHDWSSILGDKFKVCVRAGHHCALPLHNLLGLPNGTLRASFGVYNDKSDIDELMKGLVYTKDIFEEKENG